MVKEATWLPDEDSVKASEVEAWSEIHDWSSVKKLLALETWLGA